MDLSLRRASKYPLSHKVIERLYRSSWLLVPIGTSRRNWRRHPCYSEIARTDKMLLSLLFLVGNSVNRRTIQHRWSASTLVHVTNAPLLPAHSILPSSRLGAKQTTWNNVNARGFLNIARKFHFRYDKHYMHRFCFSQYGTGHKRLKVLDFLQNVFCI